MCGICGIAWSDPAKKTPAGLIERMADRLVHRGPDGQGFHEAPGISLGHRRLAIIDVAGGTQPIANEDKTIWVTFNGEIYNFQTLQSRLEAAGHCFHTRCDTEVLVHLYEEHGVGMLDHLRGMFAFAIWDSRTRTLFLARDRLGKKPLVYRHDADGLRFASELKSLLADAILPRDIDPLALDDYLTYQYVPHPRTILKGFSKLPAAHYLLYRDGVADIQRYWSPPYEEEVVRPEAEYIEQLRSTLSEAVRLRMISDVPLGAFLSGGIDSTIVVGLMRQLSNAAVRTFSIGFPVPEYDESRFARIAAEHLQTEHTEFHVDPAVAQTAEELSWFYDEPFGDSSAIPTYYVAKLARQSVTVALTGDAGDELFAGYPRYRAIQIANVVDQWIGPAGRKSAALVESWIPSSGWQKSKRRQFKRLLQVLSMAPPDRYRRLVSIFDDDRRSALYDPAFALQVGNRDPRAWFRELYTSATGRDTTTQATLVDLLSYLPGDLMTKTDIASMANGLECRCPLMDQEVVALAGRMPLSMKMRGGTSKYILKKAFAEFLPPALRNRPKMGFGVPLDHWFRGPLVEMLADVLTPAAISRRGWFRFESVDQLIREHRQRAWDHGARLWALLMLELWAKNFVDRG